jgi:hypothetical protein
MIDIDDGDYIGFMTVDATGRILNASRMPGFMYKIQVAPEGCSFVLGMEDPETHYMKDGEIVPRPANTAKLSGMSLLTLPIPCVITAQGVAHDCSDDTADLSFSQPGTYEVMVSAFPMLDATFQVTQS